MTELYKVLFSYDTDKEDELALKQGDTIRITRKDSPDWWFAERLDTKESGLVPSNFIEKFSNEDAVLAIVTQDYLAQSSEEISLQKNRIITVLDQHVSEGWWKGDLNGKTGIFPADHVEFVEEGEEPANDDNKSKKDAFKLAAYGVKQGGIGSILAGGFSLRRSSTTGNRSSVNEKSSSRPNSTNTQTETSAPSIPSKPHPTLIHKDTPANINTNNNTGIAKSNSTSRAMVIHDYKPENNDEIQLMRGEYVTVVDQLENDGWWKGTSESGATGIFPSNFVQIIEQEKPPQRPARTRPATVKTESTENMAKPPPVPVTTRPTSLLSNRDSSSVTSPPPPPRPITTPPRPTTSPPIPTRRTNSIISPTSVEIGHRRIPSIPLTAPDLPPMSPVHERPSRSIPRPTSHDSTSSASAATSPLSPRNINNNNPSSSSNSSSTRPPEINANTLQHMAKPPKVNFGVNKGPPPVRSPSTSRPCSINDVVSATGEAHPAVPRRSMPPVPEISNTTTTMPPTPLTRSSTDHMKPTKPPQPTTGVPSTPDVAATTTTTDNDYHHDSNNDNDDNDGLSELDPVMVAKLRQLVKIETEKIRKEFEIRLEDERIERLRFQVEFEELKERLSSSSS